MFEPGEYAGPYLWCLHCERAYPKEKYRTVVQKGYREPDFEMQMCPYEDCDGDAVIDAWDWLKIRVDREDEYPEIPEEGKVYPLYPPHE